MALSFETTLRDAMNDTFESNIGVTPWIRFYDGVRPVDANTALSGNTKLAEGQQPSDWMANSSGGAKAKTGTLTVTGVAPGKARWFRIFKADGTTAKCDGWVGQVWTASTPVNDLGLHMINAGNVYKLITVGTTASSGGPSGNAADITDGTAHWAYQGTADMTVDNTDITNTQVTTITALTLTNGNP